MQATGAVATPVLTAFVSDPLDRGATRTAVLHAIWSLPGLLCLWAEDAGLAPEVLEAASGPAGRAVRPRPHPFVCDGPAVEALRDRWSNLPPGPSAEMEWEIDLVLPSATAFPLPSASLAALVPQPLVGPITAAPWYMPAAVLEPTRALDFLLSLPGEDRDDVVIAPSLRFLAEVAKLAAEFVLRGQVVPVVETSIGARWRPVPQPARDGQRLAALLAAMPASLRCEVPEPHCGPDARPPRGGWGAIRFASPRDVLDRVLGDLVDAGVRMALAGSRPAAEAQRLARKHGGLPSNRERSAPLPDAAGAAVLLGALVALDEDADAPGIGVTEDFAMRIAAWGRDAISRRQGAWRTCFRLVEPEGGGGRFALTVLLQSRDDPSLQVRTSELWSGNSDALGLVGLHALQAEEALLADLGRAARLWPPLADLLDGSRPDALRVGADWAARFLADGVPLLDQAGYGVLIPAWARERTVAGLGLKLTVTPSEEGSGLFGLEGLCDYRWEIALGGQALTMDEFRALAALKQPLVQVRGQWVEIKPDEIAAALAFLDRRTAGGPHSALEALRLAAGAEKSPAGLPVVAVEARGWLGDLLGRSGDERIAAIAPPPEFRGELRPYQQRGLAWLAFLGKLGLGACLADDMGLGKTVQVLALLAADHPAERRPTLVVAPMTLLGNWRREAERFCPQLEVYMHHGAERASGDGFAEAVATADLVLTTYGTALRDRERLAAVTWRRVILDEAQNIKNRSAAQTEAVRSLRAGSRIALSGTPVENRLTELHSILDFLNPGLLGGENDFRTRFAVPIERYRDEGCAALLRRITAPFVLRRRKTDRSIISDLPDKVEMIEFCNLTSEQATLYRATLDEMLGQISQTEGIKRKGLILATMTKLKQICNHPAQFLHDQSALAGRSGKLERLVEVLSEALAEGDRALVFTQYAELGAMLQRHLQAALRHEVLYLHGGVGRREREALVARFQEPGGPGVFVLSLKAGGTGLNLTAANQVVHFDRWWNPAVEDQATDRAFRIGQTRNVQVRKFVCAGTLEERIDKLITQKKDLADRIVGSGEAWLSELTVDDLRDLCALGAEAVVE